MSTVNGQIYSILIIKSQSSALLNVENFLKSRGWNIFSTTQLEAAFSFVLKERPLFIMISVGHPSKNYQH